MKKIIKDLKPYIKISQKIIKFDDIRIEEYEFHQHENPNSINDVDIDKIVVSSNLPFDKEDFKYLILYKDTGKTRSLCIFCPKLSIYKRDFDKTRCMYF